MVVRHIDRRAQILLIMIINIDRNDQFPFTKSNSCKHFVKLSMVIDCKTGRAVADANICSYLCCVSAAVAAGSATDGALTPTRLGLN